MKKLESFFKVRERNTTLSKEIIYGLLSFLPLVYVLPLVASTLGSIGIDESGAFIATAIVSGVACVLAGLLTNKPLILSIGLGMNAFFVYNICGKLGYSAEGGLTIIFLSSIIFLIFSIFNIREKIIKSLPKEIRLAVSIGLGVFLFYSGLKSAGAIVTIDDKLSLSYLGKPIIILFLVGTVLTFILLNLKGKINKYAIIIGILFVAVVGYILNLFGVSETPTFINQKISLVSLKNTVFHFDFSVLKEIKTYLMIIIFTFMNIFDTSTAFLVLHQELDLDDENGELVLDKKIFLPDSIGSLISTSLGCTTVATFTETKILCDSGSKTGISSITIGLLFFVSLLLYPVFSIFSGINIDGSYYYPVTSVGVVSIGLVLMMKIKDIDWKDWIGVVSTFAMLISMIIFYSIPDGVGIGIILYIILKLISGKIKEVSKIMILIGCVFVLYFVITLVL